MKKISKQEQWMLAKWAADCAMRVLPYFEKAHPKDNRPRKAILACRTWARTGIFKMADVRKASLDAHAAARKAKQNSPAFYAARASGHTIATAHVPQHAFGPAYYALKAISAADPANAHAKIAKELKWQKEHIPKKLFPAWKEWQTQRLPKDMKKEWLEFNKK